MKAWLARGIVFAFVGLAIGVRTAGSWLRRNSKQDQTRPFRVFLIGAFDSAGWIMAHAGPLVRCQTVDEVYVICDEPFNLELEGVTFCCASPKVRRWLGRGGGRLWVLFSEAFRLRPRIFMGYHIMPNAPLALLAAGLFGGKAIYQMTGGPIQVEGGGYRSENPLLRATRRASLAQENLLIRLVKSFDWVVVRGEKAAGYVRDKIGMERCLTLTGAIDTERFAPAENRAVEIDLVVVSRLVGEFKGIERFLEVMARLKVLLPNVQATIIGDGPAREEFEEDTRRNLLEHNIRFLGRRQDVRTVLRQSRLFVLLSPSEGMSIAMLEAMACGLPAVVTNVGELGDALKDDGGGVLVEYRDSEEVALLIYELLKDPERCYRMSCNARRRILERYSMNAIANLWDSAFSSSDQSKRFENPIVIRPILGGKCGCDVIR